MSIYASLPGVSDDDPTGPPWIYQGSHVLPADDHPRGGEIGFAQIPSHITHDGRDDQPEDRAPWPWLRLSLDDLRTADPTVVLNRPQVAHLIAQLTAWHDSTGDDVTDQPDQTARAVLTVTGGCPEAADDGELTAEEARDLADDLGTQLYRAEDALAFVGECCDIADREGQPITTAQVREWLKGARCGRQLLADRAADPATHRPGDTDPATLVELRAITEEMGRSEPRHPLETDRA